MSDRSPLDFTVYRQTLLRLDGCVQQRDEPTGVPLPDAVRKALLGDDRLYRVHIYDGPYACGPIYGLHPLPADAFYVYYGRTEPACVGRGRVMIFTPAGQKLYDGSDGGE